MGYNGNVLLSGEPTPEIHVSIVEYTKATDRVKNVYDELVVGPAADIGARSNDTYIASREQGDAAAQVAATTEGVARVVKLFEYTADRTMSVSDTPPAPRYLAKLATAAEALARIRRLARPMVFTNGVFDVLHRGHVTYLDQARSLGASLVVAVNSDASVRRLGKAADRPLNPLDDRMAVLAGLAAVDLVVPVRRRHAARPDRRLPARRAGQGCRLHGGDDGRRGRGDRRRWTIRADSVCNRALDDRARRQDQGNDVSGEARRARAIANRRSRPTTRPPQYSVLG